MNDDLARLCTAIAAALAIVQVLLPLAGRGAAHPAWSAASLSALRAQLVFLAAGLLLLAEAPSTAASVIAPAADDLWRAGLVAACGVAMHALAAKLHWLGRDEVLVAAGAVVAGLLLVALLQGPTSGSLPWLTLAGQAAALALPALAACGAVRRLVAQRQAVPSGVRT